MVKILVIGGTRFIGAKVVETLYDMGHNVAVFNRGQTPNALPDDVQQITGDINDLAASREALQAFAPNVVLHNIVLNKKMVTEMQDIFRGIASRFVLTSSMDVYQSYGRLTGIEDGPVDNTPGDETSPLRTSRFPYRTDDMPPDHRYYDYDKIPAEEAALNDPDLPGTVLRLPMVLGANDAQRRLLPLLQPMRDNRKAIVMDERYAQWVSTYGYVDNVAQAMAMAATDPRAEGQIYNVGDAALSTMDLAEMIREMMEWSGEFLCLPPEELPESLQFGIPNPAQHLVFKAERIQNELGYMPVVQLTEGIRRTIGWELDNPPEPMPEALTDYSAQDAVLAALKR
ncbi:NAD-dependent epimerase/dehydratase family protein [Phototrophicus methaneseepsis]|uniref:NAD-dependent epimerase/dehydratase family protein n=1 Tax=Phototrophicus methaneseepsis TaxID=2710758 RepID=A0A7S8IF62_9CHLR|nr:NAD-dependent epimerase/dehydratase family protein [Phototrophicus methaneseepsis]QPC83189.1 NAD-dependent epimerase/dehydratase family protein [Phototrophicus methaneseepsis]